MSSAGGGFGGLARDYAGRRYKILFCMLLLTLLAAPILAALRFSGMVLESLLAATLLAAILPFREVRDRPYLLWPWWLSGCCGR